MCFAILGREVFDCAMFPINSFGPLSSLAPMNFCISDFQSAVQISKMLTVVQKDKLIYHRAGQRALEHLV